MWVLVRTRVFQVEQNFEQILCELAEYHYVADHDGEGAEGLDFDDF